LIIVGIRKARQSDQQGYGGLLDRKRLQDGGLEMPHLRD
jgi:hypothetical protein